MSESDTKGSLQLQLLRMADPKSEEAVDRVDSPNINDVLCGRGGSINSHAGK